jgi:photosystem II stability/assembly factor-like uncharacterized protein
MKQSVTWLILVTLATAIGMLGMSCASGVAPQADAPAEPTVQRSLEWQSLDGPYERVAFALAFAPTIETIYAGTWGHGVYSSWNGGRTWEPILTDQARYVRTLAVLPSSDQVIYAGTYAQGLWWSQDGGWTWKQLGSSKDIRAPLTAERSRSHFHIESLLVFSDQGTDRILAGTRNGVWSSGALDDTWTHLKSGFPDTDSAYIIRALARDPAGGLYAGTEAGLYTSQDGGQTWQLAKMPDDYAQEAQRVNSLAVVIDTNHLSGTLLIGTQGVGLYGLDIESRTWFTPTVGFPEDERAQTIQELLAAPGGVAYAGTVDFGVFETRDGGRTWQQKVKGLPSDSRSILSMARDPTSDILYAGTYGDGVYQLHPGSQRWEPANEGLPVDFPVQKIAFAGSHGKQLFAGLKVGGLYLNTDRQEPSRTWKRIPQALPIGPARDMTGLAVSGPNRTTIVIAAATGLFRSQDAGTTWQHLGVEQGLPQGDVRARTLAQARRNSDVLFAALAGGEGIYRSDDGGANWRSVAGGLDEGKRTQVCCLAVGAHDANLFIGLEPEVYTETVYVTHDTGAHWRSLPPIGQEGLEGLQELRWSQRTAWDVFLHGGPREMLYARTTRGIYVSYGDEQAWRLRLRGFFSSLLADPYRPWMVYVASPGTILSREFAAPISLTSDLWVSDDGGETWTWAGPGPSPAPESTVSITTLALNPKDTHQLYAGSEGDGVFWADLSSVIPPFRPLMPRAVALLVLLLLLLVGLAYVIDTGIRLGHPHGLPAYSWPELALIRIRHASQVGLVSNPHTPLLPLERLALARAPAEPFQPRAVWQALDDQEIPTNMAQVETTLDGLALDYQLLRRTEGNYRQVSPLLGRIARARFWDSAEERERLIQKVRSESRLRADAHRFFELAGFATSTFDGGLKVKSTQPKYGLLGAEQGIYVHLHTSEVLDTDDIRQTLENAEQASEEGSVAGLSCVVVSGPPQVEAYRAIDRLRGEEDLHVALLTDASLRAARDEATAHHTLLQSLRRAFGRVDLFQLDEPAVDMLDFFGREDVLKRIGDDCRTGQVMALRGMVGLGKTSLARQILGRSPNAVVALIDLPDHATSGVYHQVRQAWLADARLKFPRWEQLQLDLPPEQPGSEQISAEIAAIGDSLFDQTPTTHLLVVADELADFHLASADMQSLVGAVASTPNVGLLAVCGPSIRDVDSFQRVHTLQPFRRETSVQMITALAIQMGLKFEEDAIERLHQTSGGHPLILRQLAHLAQTSRAGAERLVGLTHVDQAISQYPSRYDQTLKGLWDSLTEAEQEAVRLAASLRLSPTGEVAIRLAELGWLEKVNDQWRAFSSLVESWLNARFAS